MHDQELVRWRSSLAIREVASETYITGTNNKNNNSLIDNEKE